MNITHFINKSIYGHQFDTFNYDFSMNIEELKINKLPYSMACFKMNDNSILAMDTGENAPIDFIKENQEDEFELDPSISPRKIDTPLGKKNVFYLKRKIFFQENHKYKAQFQVFGFKEDGNFSGSIKANIYSTSMLIKSFEEINKKLAILETKKIVASKEGPIKVLVGDFYFDHYDFRENDIGSFIFTINFMDIGNEIDEKHQVILNTFGFNFYEIDLLINKINKSNLPEKN